MVAEMACAMEAKAKQLDQQQEDLAETGRPREAESKQAGPEPGAADADEANDVTCRVCQVREMRC